MKCVKCFSELKEDEKICSVCGTERVTACMSCGKKALPGRTVCPDCGGEILPVYEMSVAQMKKEGFHCFLPFTEDRIYDIFLGGNHDGGGYVFHTTVGYTGEAKETVVLPSMVDGHMIHGIWNEFFCNGDCFFPGTYQDTVDRMINIKKIVVSNGIKDIWTFAFIGCCGMETLVIPTSVTRMKYDFYDLLSNGLEQLRPGHERKPITICYRGSREQWEKVDVSSNLGIFQDKGYIIMRYDYDGD